MLNELYDLIKENALLSTATVLSLSGSFFYLIKDVPLKLYGYVKYFLIKTIRIDNTNDESYHNFINNYFFEKYYSQVKHLNSFFTYEKSGNDTPTYTLDSIVTSRDRPAPIKNKKTFNTKTNFYVDSSNLIIFYKGYPIYIHIGKDRNESAQRLDTLYEKYVVLYSINKKILIDFISSVNEKYKEKLAEELNNKMFIHRNSDWYSYSNLRNLNLDNYHYSNYIKEDLVKDFEQFINNKQWYLDRNLFYKRSYLLYGEPGNGKSSLITAIANKYNIDIFLFNKEQFKSDNYFIDTIFDLKYVSSSRLKFLVFEDIDSLIDFNKRDIELLNDENELLSNENDIEINKTNKTSKKNKNQQTGQQQMSFSTFLNFFDGNLSIDNVIIFFTTNKIDEIDLALLRKGRVDMKFEIKNPDLNTVKKYYEHFFDTKIKNPNIALQKQLPMCEYENIFKTSNKEESFSLIFK